MNTRPILTICAVLISGNLLLSADEFITQYRYRAFEGHIAPEWVSTNSGPTNLLPAITKVERGETNDAFQQFWYANFNGTNQYQCKDGVPGNDLSGDFSVQAFLCLNSTSSVQTICSTVDSNTGFRLYVEDGILKGGCHYSNPSGPQEVVAAPLQAGIWYHVAFVARRSTNVNELNLWINSRKVATHDAIPVERPIDNSSLDPVFGIGLDAKVHAIEVLDYALSDFYLESAVVRDGSRGFGIPSYHDYIGEWSTNRPLERRIIETYGNDAFADFRARLEKRFFFPFANDNYIPQGLASDPENNRLFLAMYYGEPGASGTAPVNPDNHPSIIVEILMADGRLGSVFNLQHGNGDRMTSHVGGIGYWNGCLYVPDRRDLLIYDISNVPESEFSPDTFEGFAPIKLKADVTYSNLVNFDSIAFVDIDIDADHTPYIYLGDFAETTRTPTDVIPLDSQGRLKTEARVSLKTPTDSSQGIKVIYADYDSGGAGYRRTAIFSKSFSNTDSSLLAARYTHDTNRVAEELWLTGPAGFEDLAMLNGRLWTTSESGARHYQKRNTNAWDQLFPFLFAVNIADQLDQDGNGLRDQWEARFDLPAGIDPNDDADGDGFSTIKEYLADTDPLLSSDYPRIRSITASGELAFHASLSRFFTIERSDDLIDWFSMPEWTHRRGADGIEQVIVPFENGQGFYRLMFEDW